VLAAAARTGRFRGTNVAALGDAGERGCVISVPLLLERDVSDVCMCAATKAKAMLPPTRTVAHNSRHQKVVVLRSVMAGGGGDPSAEAVVCESGAYRCWVGGTSMNGLLGCGRCVAGGGVRVRRPTASSWRLLKWKVNIERACGGMVPGRREGRARVDTNRTTAHARPWRIG